MTGAFSNNFYITSILEHIKTGIFSTGHSFLLIPHRWWYFIIMENNF